MRAFLPQPVPFERDLSLGAADNSLSDSADEATMGGAGSNKVARLTASWNRRSFCASARYARAAAAPLGLHGASAAWAQKPGEDTQYASDASTEVSDDDPRFPGRAYVTESQLGTGPHLMQDLLTGTAVRQEKAPFDQELLQYAPIVGARCETARVVTMRKDEAMDSEIVHKLRSGTGLLVLEVGSSPSSRRIRVEDEQGRVGWISVVSAAGLVLVRDARAGGKGWSAAVVGAAASAASLPLLPVRGAVHVADTLLRGVASRMGLAGAAPDGDAKQIGSVSLTQSAEA